MSKEKVYPPPGYKVLTFRIEFRHPDRTLTNEEVDIAMKAILEEMEKNHDCKVVTPEIKKEWKERQEEWYGKK